MSKLADLKQDATNPNLGTARGAEMIQASLRKLGAGRSIVIDKHGTILAGNKTAENALAVGMEDVIIVPSDGSKLVVVQRTDLDLGTDAKARELSIADNRAQEVSLNWDTEVLSTAMADPNIGLSDFFSESEFKDLAEPQEKQLSEQIVFTAPQRFMRVLISVPLDAAGSIRSQIEEIGKLPGVEVDYASTS